MPWRHVWAVLATSLKWIGSDASVAAEARPIIGIWAHPSTSAVSACGGNCDQVAASYVKWVEAAGARAIPIPYNASIEITELTMSQINGIMLPGGNPDPTPGVTYAIKRAIELTRGGDRFPVFGTCLGFEWIVQALAETQPSIREGFDSENVSMSLRFTPLAAESRLFAGFGTVLRQKMESEKILFNNHHKGITPGAFAADDRLMAIFDVLATGRDRQGAPFVAAIEAKDLPIFGVQWHPEKSVFEWGANPDGSPYEDISHSAEAIAVAQALANVFVAEARNSGHRFVTSVAEKAALFYAFPITRTGPEFEQKYYFPSRRESSEKLKKGYRKFGEMQQMS